MSNIISGQIEAYRDNFLKHGPTPLGTFQNNIETQYERFSQLINPLIKFKDNNFSICDVGSGLCDLHHYLNLRELAHIYTGVEIVQEMIDSVQQIHSDIRVLNQDILANEFQEQFDFVVLSGTFNLPGTIPSQQWNIFVHAMIKKMFKLSKIGIAFNALTTYSTFQDPKLFYLSPNDTLDFLQREITRHCDLRMTSPLYEVTYVALQSSFVSSQYPDKEFRKYFS